MRKYIICSDIHGRSENLKQLLADEQEADGLIIAGDLELDPDVIADLVYKNYMNDCPIHAVSGNCDSYNPAAQRLRPIDVFDIAGGNRVFLTHGNRYGVPRTDVLSYAAEEQGCNIVIFGHTHMFFCEREAGILFINPGALKSFEYAIMTVSDDGSVSVERKSIR